MHDKSMYARRLSGIALVAALGLLLSACNGGSSSVPGLGGTSNNGKFRFVNGSADAGSIDVYVDSQKLQTLSYGQMTNYTSFSSGSHTVALDAAGTQNAIVPNQSFSVNGGAHTSLVLAGEVHPVSGAPTITVIPFNDSLYSTPGGGAAADFHNAAPAAATIASSVAFGYFPQNSPSSNQQLGQPQGVGGATQPQGLPTTAIAPTVIGFYAISPGAGGFTLLPNAVDPSGCSQNTMPCNSGNLSMYLIDGPAATTQPVAGPYPQGITASSKAALVGQFDANAY
jgi:hypothetical protein